MIYQIPAGVFQPKDLILAIGRKHEEAEANADSDEGVFYAARQRGRADAFLEVLQLLGAVDR